LVAGVVPGHRKPTQHGAAEREEGLHVQRLVQHDHRVRMEARAHQFLVAAIIGAAKAQMHVLDLRFSQ
jgi:hypothetical protein